MKSNDTLLRQNVRVYLHGKSDPVVKNLFPSIWIYTDYTYFSKVIIHRQIVSYKKKRLWVDVPSVIKRMDELKKKKKRISYK